MSEYPSHTKLVAIAVQANVPVFWEGPPGVGKTSIFYALAKKLDVPCIVQIGSIMEPSEFGFPVPEGNRIIRKPLEWVETLRDTDGILVFDELPHAPPAVQAGMLRVIYEGIVGDTPLGPNVRRCAIGNPTDLAGGWDLNPALANRFCRIQWDMSGYHKVWLKGMIEGWNDLDIPILPQGWQSRIPHWKSLVAAFAAEIAPHTLLNFPEAESQRTGPWPSPRTWDMGAILLAAAESFGRDAQYSLLAGCTGYAAAGEFIGFMKNADLPEIEKLLINPDLFPEIKAGQEHVIYAILTNLMSILHNNKPKQLDEQSKRWIQAWKVIYRAAQVAPDVVFGFVKPMLDLWPDRGRTKVPKEVSQLILKFGRDIEALPQEVD